MKKIKDKEKKSLKDLPYYIKIGFVIGFFTAFSTVILGFLILFCMPLYSMEVSLVDLMTTQSYEIVSSSWENNKVVESISYLCLLKEDKRDQVECVYNFLNDNLSDESLTNFNLNTGFLRSPEDMFTKSICCRDKAVLFDSILNNMNFKTKFINIPGHVYNVVYIDDEICDIDLTKNDFTCKKL